MPNISGPAEAAARYRFLRFVPIVETSLLYFPPTVTYRIKILFGCLALLGLAMPESHAQSQATGLDPDGERIVELVLEDNSLLHEGLVVYPFGNDWAEASRWPSKSLPSCR
jgi:hypothetical protein